MNTSTITKSITDRLGNYLKFYLFLMLFYDVNLTLNRSNAEATYFQSTRMQRFFENHANPVMLVFIG